MKTHMHICAACAVEDDDESPRFEEEIGMAWLRGFVEGAATANGKGAPGGFCEPHASYFNALMETQKSPSKP